MKSSPSSHQRSPHLLKADVGAVWICWDKESLYMKCSGKTQWLIPHGTAPTTIQRQHYKKALKSITQKNESSIRIARITADDSGKIVTAWLISFLCHIHRDIPLQILIYFGLLHLLYYTFKLLEIVTDIWRSLLLKNKKFWKMEYAWKTGRR